MSRSPKRSRSRCCSTAPRPWRGALTLLLAGLGLWPAAAHAQVQRGIVNLGFETPDLGTGACVVIIGSDAIPGWETNAAPPGSGNPNSYCGTITSATPGVSSGGQIELWANAFNGVTSVEGTQHAELNA